MTAPEPIPFIAESPQPLLRPIPQGQPFPVAALGPLSAAVEAAQAGTQAPVALAAQSALSVASLAVQCHADVQTLGGSAPVSLYCLTVAKSGERKSATDKMLMAALRAFERNATRDYEADCLAHKNEAQIWKADHDAALSKMRKSKDRIEAQSDLEALGAEPTPPLKPYLTATEPTLEGLHKLFASGQPGLGIFSDEGGGFLGGHGMSNDNRLRTIAGLSDLWGGEPIRRVRAGDGAVAMYGRRLAMHLMVQPIAAETLLADPLAQGQGFLARFLIAQPPSAIGTRLQRPRREAPELATFGARLSAILSTPRPLAEGTQQELEPRILPLSPSASELLWQYYSATEALQAPGGELEHSSSFASKSPEQACRIAATLALWSDLNAPEVSGEDMANGVALAQYYLAEAQRLGDAAIISKETEEAERLRVWLLESWPDTALRQGRDPKTILPRDVMQFGPNALRERKKIGAVIARLVEAGWLAPLPPDTIIHGKQRREAYRIGGNHVV